MDALSRVFSTLRMSSTLYARIDASAPWGLVFNVHQAIKFCLVAQGNCALVVEGDEALSLNEGDFFLTTNGARYRLCDDPRSPSRTLEGVLGPHRDVGKVVAFGGPGATTVLLNGILTFEGGEGGFVVGLLPRLIVIRRDEAQRLGFGVYVERLAAEVGGGAGAQLVANWLAGILFVHAVRAHALGEGATSGWLAALAEPGVAEALHHMHDRVAHRWTVEALAQVAGMSRSGFALRFKALVGRAPLEYLTQWRMHLAQGLLRGPDKLARVAASVGYDSETAFSKAFQRLTGTTPSAWRGRAKAVGEGPPRIDVM